MVQKGYLIDTHVLIWLLQDDKKLNDNIKNDIEYFQNKYSVSVISLWEYAILQQLGKIDNVIPLKKVVDTLKKLDISIYGFTESEVDVLSKLPTFKNHNDPFDRGIISQAIKFGLTLVSADTKFEPYCKHGLKFMAI